MNHEKITISINSSLLEVLAKLESLPVLQTVFVLDNNKTVIGTITDGDIRRGFLKGLSLTHPLENFVFKNFHFITEGAKDFNLLRDFRLNRIKAVPLLSKKGHLLKVIDFSKTKSILPVDAVLMAGGLGTRLQPLTANTPKPLLKVGNKEIIAYNFDRLSQFGINNQFVTVNYLGDQVETFCNDYNEDINFTIIKEKKYMGTAGSLSLIENFENDTVLLMNSDLLTNIDFEDFYKSFKKEEADIMVASIPYDVNLPYAILESENRIVSSFKEKPSYTYYASSGIYLIKKEILEIIPKEEFFNATDLMDLVIQKGKKLIHFPIRGYWLDIGKHSDYEQAQKDIAHINWD